MVTKQFIKKIQALLPTKQTNEVVQTSGITGRDPGHPANRLSISRVLGLLTAGETGNLVEIADLYEDMEERDPHILAEMSKRRLAVTDLDAYSISAPVNPTNKEQELADYARGLWDSVPERETLLYQLADGIGKGIACSELRWHEHNNQLLIESHDLKPLAWFKLVGASLNELRLLDQDNQEQGLWPCGWITHFHNPRSGYNSRNALYRSLALVYLIKNYSVQDWAQFNERYGQPITIGKYDQGATPEQLDILRRAVTHVGKAFGGILPKEMEIELVQATAMRHTGYKDFIDYLDGVISKVVLGAILTSDTKGTGSYALGQVHNDVRRDIYKSDVRQLASTLNRQLIRPLILLNHPQAQTLRLPTLESAVKDVADIDKMSQVIERLTRSKVPLPLYWVYQTLDIPEPSKDTPLLDTSMQTASRIYHQASGQQDDELDSLSATLDKHTDQAWSGLLDPVKHLVSQATSLEDVQIGLEALSGDMDGVTVIEQSQKAFAVASLAGMADE